MGRAISMNGKKIGRWTVMGRNPVSTSSGDARWDCICDCGNKSTVRGGTLRNGESKSCGCASSEMLAENSYKHGYYGTYQYQAWSSIKQWCYNKSHRAYHSYGGRGIKMYYRWKDDPVAFCEWLDRFLGPRPEGHSLDRINNDGDYEPRNLRWADAKTQRENQRTSK